MAYNYSFKFQIDEFNHFIRLWMLPLGILTISGSTISRSIQSETRTQYLHDTVRAAVKHKVPNELIFNFKLKPSKYRISPNKRQASNKRSIAAHSD